MTKHLGALVLMLFGIGFLPSPSLAQDVWVEVTKPMLACGSPNDYADGARLPELVLQTLVVAPGDLDLPEECYFLEVGNKLKLDNQPDTPDSEYIVKMWSPVCPQGCVPSMDVVYAPPRRIVGAYLRPTDPPPGW